ncbi:hypothetical protein B7G68_05235 [Caulobacter segnis]|uniref:Uncharacterized protein n=2 Tax=Caulobacter segnis TaxID=88688 RepID=D5VIF1_CAUST|nr:hypothetical protein [Caulobacter segnis]ADG09525.1 conserved hypothetical protein [Caulobacter segnis ATCC 21756]AVQ01313.1 hypothetical protein B7G68_05235 [Caulobacter segnis]
MMSLERFEDLAEIYGGDIARWPEGEREAARALLASEAGRLTPVLAAAAQLDRLLDLAPAQSPDAALMGRLISAAPQPAGGGRRWIAGLSAALGLSAAAFAGVLVGVTAGRPAPMAAPVAVTTAAEPVVTAVDTSAALQDAIAEPAAL